MNLKTLIEYFNPKKKNNSPYPIILDKTSGLPLSQANKTRIESIYFLKIQGYFSVYRILIGGSNLKGDELKEKAKKNFRVVAEDLARRMSLLKDKESLKKLENTLNHSFIRDFFLDNLVENAKFYDSARETAERFMNHDYLIKSIYRNLSYKSRQLIKEENPKDWNEEIKSIYRDIIKTISTFMGSENPQYSTLFLNIVSSIGQSEKITNLDCPAKRLERIIDSYEFMELFSGNLKKIHEKKNSN